MKWLASMNLEVRIHEETTLAKREVRRSHRVSWDKFITNLKHETYRIQPIVCKILKQISKYLQETAKFREIWMKMYFLNTMKNF